MTKVSVIVPIYNAEKYLTKCIDSLITQSLKEIEIICIDDYSIDKSVEIIKNYCDLDSRIVPVFLHENKGAANARNIGIEYASGKYIQFVDSDDYLCEDALEKLFVFAENNDCDMCFHKPNIILQETLEVPRGIIGSYPGVFEGKELLRRFSEEKEFFEYACLVFYKSSFLQDNALRFNSIKIGEGGDLIVRALCVANRVTVVDKNYYNYYVNNDSVTHQSNQKILTLLGQIYRYCNILKIFAKEENGKSIKVYLEHLRNKISGGIKGLSQEQKVFILNSLNDSFSRYVFDSLFPKDRYIDDFLEVELLQIRQAESIMIYGAGYATSNIVDLLNRYRVEIKGFIVSSLEGNPKSVYGHHVYSIDQIEDFDRNMLIIVAANKRYHKDIEDALKGRGFQNRLFLNVAI